MESLSLTFEHVVATYIVFFFNCLSAGLRD